MVPLPIGRTHSKNYANSALESSVKPSAFKHMFSVRCKTFIEDQSVEELAASTISAHEPPGITGKTCLKSPPMITGSSRIA
jgi:hypothetical protein